MNFQEYLSKVKHGGFKSFLKRTEELGIKIEILEHERIPVLKLSYDGTVLFCYKRNMPILRRMGNLTKNKVITKMILESIDIRTPRGIVATSPEQAVSEINEKNLHYPLIVKPVDGSLAKGVTWNITSEQEVAQAVEHALAAYGYRKDIKIIVEEMFVGNEYRVLVFNDQVLSCVEKIPAGVTGDGKNTIKNLIHEFNKDRRHGFEIKLDSTAKDTIAAAGHTLQTVLPKDFFFKFRNNLNMSDGGRSIDRTKDMSPTLKATCVRAIQAVGLTYGGIDLLTNDISSESSQYVILEINPNPFFNMHEKPLVEGEGIDVSQKILENLFPALKKNV